MGAVRVAVGNHLWYIIATANTIKQMAPATRAPTEGQYARASTGWLLWSDASLCHTASHAGSPAAAGAAGADTEAGAVGRCTADDCGCGAGAGACHAGRAGAGVGVGMGTWGIGAGTGTGTGMGAGAARAGGAMGAGGGAW